jgi:hypothetical protein
MRAVSTGAITASTLGLTAAILIAILTIGVYLIVNYSAVSEEYVCEGETRRSDGPPQKDTGRLRVEDYRWWVRLWSDSDGLAKFESENISHLTRKLNKSGEGSLSLYMGFDDPNQIFLFRRALGQLGIQQSYNTKILYVFVGNCKETL